MKNIELLSIIIPYYNRRQTLLNTLNSINVFKGDYPIEVIVVDDGSTKEHMVSDIKEIFPFLNINLIFVENSTWRGPTIAYNIGFNSAKGDVVFMNGSDCIHMGDLIGYVFKNMKANSYLSFSAYRGTDELNTIFGNMDWSLKELEKIKRGFNINDAKRWHIHSGFFHALIPFCAAITRGDLETLSGYDERYKDGIAYEDSDLEVRLVNMGLDTLLIDEPYCLHQKHPLTKYVNNNNYELFTRLQKEEPLRVKAPINKIYVR